MIDSFAAASAIVSWFSGQKFITIYSDIVNGRLSSVLKLGTSSVRTAIVVPAAINNKLITALSKEISDVSNLPLDEIELLQDTTSLSVETVVEVADATDWVIDELGGPSKAIVKEAGDFTGVDKPVRELREEVVLVITHPKKAAKRLGKNAEEAAKTVWDIITLDW